MTSPAAPDTYDGTAPDAAEIESIAARAYASIPAELRDHVKDVVIRIEEYPDEQTLADLGIESPYDLLGLYHGVDLTQKSIADPQPQTDMIFLYRRPLLDYWIENDFTLGNLVRHVLIHEIGHHFGFSDDDMDAIERKS
jgi:predicted Zn-dependent protease with MMP-like domain